MKYFLIIIGILIFISVVLFLIVLNQIKKIKQLSESIVSLVDANNNLHEEIKKLNNVDKIKADNRRESNEKIDALSDGDIVDNALDVLCNKNKNRN